MGKLNILLCLALCVIYALAKVIPEGASVVDYTYNIGVVMTYEPEQVTSEKGLARFTEKVTNHFQTLGAQKNGTRLELVKIHSVIFQLGAGYLWHAVATVLERGKFVGCAISLVERSWVDFVKLDVLCGSDKKYQLHTPAKERDDSPPPDAIVIATSASVPLVETELLELHPQLAAAFTERSKTYSLFDIKLKRIIDGQKQDSAGTSYTLTIEGEDRNGLVSEFRVSIFENLQGKFIRISVYPEGSDSTILGGYIIRD